MRRLYTVFLILGLIFCTACGKLRIFTEEEGKSKMHSFLKNIVQEKRENATEFLTEEAKKEIHIQFASTTDLDGYDLKGKYIEDGNTYYEFFLSQINTVKPYHKIIECIAHVQERPRFQIQDVKEVRHLEIYPIQKQMVFRTKNMEQPIELFSMKDLPAQYKPKEMEQEQKINVSREGFHQVRISFDQKKVAFSTYGENSFVGIYDLSSKRIIPIDLILQGNIESFAWSPNHRYLSYVTMMPVGSGFCRFYDVEQDEVIEMLLPKEMTYPEYSLQHPKWVDENTIKIDVMDHGVAKKIDKKLLGAWTYNIRSKAFSKK